MKISTGNMVKGKVIEKLFGMCRVKPHHFPI